MLLLTPPANERAERSCSCLLFSKLICAPSALTAQHPSEYLYQGESILTPRTRHITHRETLSVEPTLHDADYLLANKLIYLRFNPGSLKKWLPFINVEGEAPVFACHPPSLGL